MLCQSPIPTQTGLVPCRQCMNCRINLQRTWAARIQLESLWHPYSSFVTLTYDAEYLPVNQSAMPTLSPRDLTLFLKRFRNSNGSFRYFACGEYGSQTERPHYHLVLFGISPLWEDRIQESWSDPDTMMRMGYISVYDLNEARAAYVAQYTTKKMTRENSHGLNGRYPEFSRMSKFPGIGAPCIRWLADQHRTRLGSKALVEAGDVFTAIRINGKIWPLGSYLRKLLRLELGVPLTAPERSAHFGRVHRPEPGEWACPLEDYCPNSDIINVQTYNKVVIDEKEKAEALPQINKEAEHRARKVNRRKIITQHV